MNALSSLLDNLGYGTIFLLMLLESTVIPVPSELVVAPAAYHAAGGHLDVALIWAFATAGADIGASVNYAAGYYLGRPLIYRFADSRMGRMCLLSREKVEKSEKFFYNHGATATITGRLIPGIRHLISIPAGLSKMKYPKFLLYTTIGAGCWHGILAAIGWHLHSVVPAEQLNGKILEYANEIKVAIVAAVALALALFAARALLRRQRRPHRRQGGACPPQESRTNGMD